MKCNSCEWDKDGECIRASSGHLGDIEDTSCLLKCQISLLRDIWLELSFENDDRESGNGWKG